MNAYEAQRLQNIKRNEALIKELGIQQLPDKLSRASQPPAKKRKLDDVKAAPTRASARIASIPAPAIAVEYSSDDGESRRSKRQQRKANRGSTAKITRPPLPSSANKALPDEEIARIRAGWTDWKPVSQAPTRNDVTGRLHFTSHPSFTPNVSPEEMLRQGVFGGSYFRPLYSKRLGIIIEDDWQELPSSWTEGLDVERSLICPDYDPTQNKYGVSGGQSIEQWEAAGWISHRDDVRGWFQWYCRFYQGRRCEDDERQISRWKKCVGETGRWRRLLLKKYSAFGVTSVHNADEVSPVMHQTCFHWALQVTQADLDEFLETGR